ncbi:MAG: DMT family transporter [Xanthomonadaceae bacterium]|jgi:O-acetylserine/cysteine efflux transporter|nr:DMT family transporter [Xanthomonadaceae bacterium]
MPVRDIALVVLVCAVWALNFLLSAFALQELPPLLFTALRMALLALLLWPFLRRPEPGQWPRLLAISLGLGVCHFGLSFWALHLSGDLSSLAILMQSYVPMAALLAWALLGERIGRPVAAAIAVSFLGVLVLGFDPIVLDQPLAMLLMLGSALMLALGTVLMRGLKGQTVWSQQGWLAVTSVGPLLGLSLLFEGAPVANAAAAGIAGWGGVVYSALVSSLLGHGLYYLLLQRHPVAAVTPWLLLSPLMTVVLGVAVWGDRPGPTLWLGGAMVLGGVLAIALHARRAPR